MEEIEKRNLGRTGAAVSKLGFGSAGLGELSQKASEEKRRERDDFFASSSQRAVVR